LKVWAQNEAAFEQAAAGRPLLEKAVPTASDIAALGDLGLMALDAIEHVKPLTSGQLSAGRELLGKLRDFAAASADFAAIGRMKQPPAALIILTAPDVQRLVDAAERAGGQ
jgi:hexosaminidase